MQHEPCCTLRQIAFPLFCATCRPSDHRNTGHAVVTHCSMGHAAITFGLGTWAFCHPLLHSPCCNLLLLHHRRRLRWGCLQHPCVHSGRLVAPPFLVAVAWRSVPTSGGRGAGEEDEAPLQSVLRRPAAPASEKREPHHSWIVASWGEEG